LKGGREGGLYKGKIGGGEGNGGREREFWGTSVLSLSEKGE